MKKTIALIMGVFLIAFLLLLGPDFEKPQEADSVNITFVSPYANSGYWGLTASGILDECNSQGINVKCIGFTEPDTVKQIRYIKSAIYAHVDGIITAGIENSEEFPEVLEMASAAGIPVVLIDYDIPESNRLCYIGTDNYEAGYLAGRDIAEATSGNGRIAILTNALSSENQEERIDGFYAAISEYPNLQVETVLSGSEQYMVMKEKIVRMLDAYPQVNTVFCVEGYSSSAMSRFILENHEKYSDLVTVTFDTSSYAIECLEKGKIYSTIQQDPYIMGQRAVEYLSKYLKGQTQQPSVIRTGVQSIKPENMDQMYNYTSKEVAWYTY